MLRFVLPIMIRVSQCKCS